MTPKLEPAHRAALGVKGGRAGLRLCWSPSATGAASTDASGSGEGRLYLVAGNKQALPDHPAIAAAGGVWVDQIKPRTPTRCGPGVVSNLHRGRKPA
jgi:hypothetical protein